MDSRKVQVRDAEVIRGHTVFYPGRNGSSPGTGRVEYINGNRVGVRSEDGHTPFDHTSGSVKEWHAHQLVFQPWNMSEEARNKWLNESRSGGGGGKGGGGSSTGGGSKGERAASRRGGRTSGS
jgi:hypothetical protein